MTDIFHIKASNKGTRNSFMQLSKLSSKSNGQKGLAFIAPSVWNELSTDEKSTTNLNIFKHKIKERFLDNLKKKSKIFIARL